MSNSKEFPYNDQTVRVLEALLPSNKNGWHTFVNIVDDSHGHFMGQITIYIYPHLGHGFSSTAVANTIEELEARLIKYTAELNQRLPAEIALTESNLTPEDQDWLNRIYDEQKKV